MDGKDHKLALYDSTSSQLVVNRAEEKVAWEREAAGELTALRVGTVEQGVLATCGDDHRINWGYAYVAASSRRAKAAIGAERALTESFLATGQLPAQDDSRMPRMLSHTSRPTSKIASMTL